MENPHDVIRKKKQKKKKKHYRNWYLEKKKPEKTRNISTAWNKSTNKVMSLSKEKTPTEYFKLKRKSAQYTK